MYHQHKIVTLSPVSNAASLSLLMSYLLRHRAVIDRHLCLVSEPSEDPAAELRTLQEQVPGFIEIKHCNVGDMSAGGLPAGALAQCVEENTIYIYLSDSICYLAPDALERLLAFRLAFREHLFVLPNMVNNGYIDHLRQRMGLVEFAPFLTTPTAHGTAWKHSRFAEAVHWTFLRHERDGRLEEHRAMFHRWICVYHEHITLDCMAWFGEDMAQLLPLPEGVEVEKYLTKEAPKKLGRPNAICGGSLMVNFAFPHQREYMLRTELWQHYENLAQGKSLPLAIAERQSYPVEEMSVCFFTCDRSTRGKLNYIGQSLENLARATWRGHSAPKPQPLALASDLGANLNIPQSEQPNKLEVTREGVAVVTSFGEYEHTLARGQNAPATIDPRLRTVHLMIDGPKAEFIGLTPVTCETHPIPAAAWGDEDDVQGGVSCFVPQTGRTSEAMKNWDVHQRIAYSYHRCFTKALEENACGVLICEDDIDFRDGWLDKLQAVLDEIAKDGKRWFTLSLYTVGDLDAKAELDMGDLYGIYPEWLFWGGQAVFFSRDAIKHAIEFWAKRGWRDIPYAENANDALVGRFGHSLWRQFGMEGGHYRCYRDLVQHEGEITTGLSGYYHKSETFARPWPGEEVE